MTSIHVDVKSVCRRATLTMADGKVIEHWANRDDLGTVLQLGWAAPSPLYLLRMVLAKRRARRGGTR